jgi:hypothetical protein
MLAGGRLAARETNLSSLLLQRGEFLDRTRDICLESISFTFETQNRIGIPVPVAQLQESACQPPSRSPCRASEPGRRTLCLVRLTKSRSRTMMRD